jgi:hypothetical protein
MAYLVKTTPHAECDLARLYRQVNAEHSEMAMKWYLGIKEAILPGTTAKPLPANA